MSEKDATNSRLKAENEALKNTLTDCKIEQHTSHIEVKSLRHENAELQNVLKEFQLKKVPPTDSNSKTLRFKNGDLFIIGTLNAQGSQQSGTYIWASGSVYCGTFSPNGQMTGSQGVYLNASGGRYSGDFRDDQRHGEGRLEYVNGDLYAGRFHLDQRHGRGVLTSAKTGSVYSGMWACDKPHGS
eukprot:gene38453-47483_t